MPIHQIGMLCCRARFGILCVEALPERSNHFREPEHVQSVQDNISTSVPRENSQRESVPHFEDGLEELPRDDGSVDEARASECAHQDQAVDELQRASGLFSLV